MLENIEKLMVQLEKQELETFEGHELSRIYSQLLAIYLQRNDLYNALYLWKRIPSEIKNSTPELNYIWSVAQGMWKKDFTCIYKSLNAFSWSDVVSNLMKDVQGNELKILMISIVYYPPSDNVRASATQLIAKAYDSIHLSTVTSLLGLSPEGAADLCREKGWKIESNIVYPVYKVYNPKSDILNEDQLYKLTDFVSFLEN